jgi:transcriptional regulator with XRE-family HTH domain
MNEKQYPLPAQAAKTASKAICDFLKTRRIELGLTQDDLSERMAVRRDTISKMENAIFNISLENLMNWCYCLGCNPFISTLEDNPESHEKAMQQLGRRPDSLPKN